MEWFKIVQMLTASAFFIHCLLAKDKLSAIKSGVLACFFLVEVYGGK